MRSITKIVDGFKQNWTRELSEDAIVQRRAELEAELETSRAARLRTRITPTLE